jgi:hypothetical protein
MLQEVPVLEVVVMLRLSLRPIIAAVALTALSACSFEPFRVGPPEGIEIAPPAAGAPVVVRGAFDFNPTPRAFGLCYSELINEPAELLAKAREVCPYGHIEYREEEDLFWNGCALLQPRRAGFVCYPEPAPDA